MIMNQEEPLRDQSERLRQKIEKAKEGGDIKVETQTTMPSRTDLHRNKKNKTKLKVKFPIIRLLALFFILLPVVIISTYSYLGSKQLNASESVNGFEKIKIGESKNTDEDTSPPVEQNSSNEEVGVEEEETSVDPAISDNVEVNNGEGDSSDTTEGTDVAKEIEVDESIKEETSTKADNQSFIYHTVKSEETLFRIAMNYYQSQDGIKMIQEANQLLGTDIKVGQVLKIPKK
jgi:LysM repeat protein